MKPKVPKSNITGYILIAFIVGLGIVQAICILGATRYLLRTSTYDLKIDTRGATVDDILGGISMTTGATATAPPYSGAATPTAVETSSASEATATAEAYLHQFKNVMGDMRDANPDFSVARALGIHDHIYHGINGFACYSDNTELDKLKPVTDSNNGCSMNGMAHCLGITTIKSTYTSAAYTLNTDYLFSMTNLTKDNVTDLWEQWSFIRAHADNTTLVINISEKAKSKLAKLGCKDDSFHLVYRYSGSRNNAVKYSVPSYIIGIIAFCIQFLVTIVFYENLPVYAGTVDFVLVGIFAEFVVIVLWSAAFGWNQARVKTATQSVLDSSVGLKVHGTLYNTRGGNGAMFVVALVFQIIVLVALFIRQGQQERYDGRLPFFKELKARWGGKRRTRATSSPVQDDVIIPPGRPFYFSDPEADIAAEARRARDKAAETKVAETKALADSSPDAAAPTYEEASKSETKE